jgi:hypothetical protein
MIACMYIGATVEGEKADIQAIGFHVNGQPLSKL